jgi:hypothetical protein
VCIYLHIYIHKPSHTHINTPKTKQYLETYGLSSSSSSDELGGNGGGGHHMAVYAVKWNPFHPRLFLSCSADWTVKARSFLFIMYFYYVHT